jgi:hypothetical protein
MFSPTKMYRVSDIVLFITEMYRMSDIVLLITEILIFDPLFNKEKFLLLHIFFLRFELNLFQVLYLIFILYDNKFNI